MCYQQQHTRQITAILMLKLFLPCLTLAGSFGPALYGTDITVPLEDGTIEIQNAQLQTGVAELSFTLRNRTSFPWTKLKLQFEVDARCNGEQRHWSGIEQTFLGWMGDPAAQGANLSEEGKERLSLTVRSESGLLLSPPSYVDECDTRNDQSRAFGS